METIHIVNSELSTIIYAIMLIPQFCGIFFRILDENPSLVGSCSSNGWTALHAAVINRRSDIVDLILLNPSCAINSRDAWDSYNTAVRSSFASDKFAHRVLSGSTAMHYACLVGDMEIVEKLLRAGADWERTDYNKFLPEHNIDGSCGEDKKIEYRRLCEEERERRRLKRLAEEEARKIKEAESKAKEEAEEKNPSPQGSETDGDSTCSTDSEQSQKQAVSTTILNEGEALRRFWRDSKFFPLRISDG
jgi:ATP-dependent Clp protease ATP-binding subunit ClpB